MTIKAWLTIRSRQPASIKHEEDGDYVGSMTSMATGARWTLPFYKRINGSL